MEITNEERREVARELRLLDVSDIGNDDNIVDSPEESGELFERILEIANDYRAGLHYFPSHFKGKAAVELLADLIDRPTCKPKDRGRGYVDAVCDSFCCPNCGFEIDVHIGEDQHLTEAAKYCPNCGAEVIK